jgi:hypothetical protein
MRRRWILLPFAAILSASQCSPLHTSIENGTGSPIYLRISFDGSKPGFGNLKAGGLVNLEERLPNISRIQYRYDEKVCTLSGAGIRTAVVRRSYGLDHIVLKGC